MRLLLRCINQVNVFYVAFTHSRSITQSESLSYLLTYLLTLDLSHSLILSLDLSLSLRSESIILLVSQYLNQLTNCILYPMKHRVYYKMHKHLIHLYNLTLKIRLWTYAMRPKVMYSYQIQGTMKCCLFQNADFPNTFG